MPDRKFTLFTTRILNRSTTSRITIAASATALAIAALVATISDSPGAAPSSSARLAATTGAAISFPASHAPGAASARTSRAATVSAPPLAAGQARTLTLVAAVTAAGTASAAASAAASSARARRLARRTAWLMMWRYGWRARRQFPYLKRLWMRESSWNVYATNPYSGAYGIPQAVPGWKMASAGRRWRTSAKTQIRWGMRYIKGRYGSPRRAWAHECAYGWY